MKATIVNEKHNAKISYDQKELVRAYVVLSGNKEVIKVELFMGRSNNANVVYCNFFVIGGVSGAGSAGGGGYDKQSAAVSAAIESAGIQLSEDIGGVGPTAIREALGAIMEALGYQDHIIVEV
jgi:hypothetical protein